MEKLCHDLIVAQKSKTSGVFLGLLVIAKFTSFVPSEINEQHTCGLCMTCEEN